MPVLWLWLGLCLPVSHAWASTLAEHRVEDLDYGVALFHFFQQDELSAIVRLMVAQQKGLERQQLNEADLLLADLYYGYGLFEDSRQLYARLLDAEVPEAVQNRIWFNLARLRYNQGYTDIALDLLSRISDQLPESIEIERNYLLTNLLLDSGNLEDATRASREIDSESIWNVYADYNLGVTMMESDRYSDGRSLLEDIGQMIPRSAEAMALRDQANLSLGLKQLRLGLPKPALENISRIRLEGPLSNDALLASGWGWHQLGEFDKALIPWRRLLQRNAVDAATQEAILAIPTSYAKAGQDQQALRYYEIAARQFDLQLALLDSTIDSIESGELMAALRANAIIRDANTPRQPANTDFVPQLRIMLASIGFQSEIRRYQQLLDIRESLEYWGKSLPVLELMLAERRRGFDLKLPSLQSTARFDQLESIQRQRDQLAAKVEAIESGQQHAALATLEERDHLQRLERVSASIGKIGLQRNTEDQLDMQRLLGGLLQYEIDTDYPVRFWKVQKQLILLDRALAEANQRVESLGQVTRRNDIELGLFDERISGQSRRISQLEQSVGELLLQQENHINQLAIDSIRVQQQHIVQLRINARFELAKLYDRLATEQ